MRFRPIMMTTMAAMLGAMPLALSFGDGCGDAPAAGIAIVGGLIVSQVLTLLHDAGAVSVSRPLPSGRAWPLAAGVPAGVRSRGVMARPVMPAHADAAIFRLHEERSWIPACPNDGLRRWWSLRWPRRV